MGLHEVLVKLNFKGEAGEDLLTAQAQSDDGDNRRACHIIVCCFTRKCGIPVGIYTKQ